MRRLIESRCFCFFFIGEFLFLLLFLHFLNFDLGLLSALA
jgi:hypothetical protein